MASKELPSWAYDRVNWAKELEAKGRLQQNPRERTRTKPMKLLVIALKAALHHLGYDGIYHMESICERPQDSYMWGEAMRYKATGKGKPFTREEWDHLLGDFEGCLDQPSALFMPELIAAYPEAQVIVCERDADRWYESLERTILQVVPRWWEMPLALLDGEFFRPWSTVAMHFDALFGGDLGDPEGAKAAYRAYRAEVRRLVPEGERRLEYRMGDGWEPLCKFLGKKVPKGVDFPHVNESGIFRTVTAIEKAAAWKRLRAKVFQSVLGLGAIGFIALGPFGFLPKAWLSRFGRR